MKALQISKLSKTYKNKVKALKGISFEVEKGEFFGMLGPNGAGKSTTIGIVSNLVIKSSGDVKVFGKDVVKEAEEAKSYIGLVPQEFNFNIFEAVLDVVVNQAGYHGVPRKEALKRAEHWLKKLGIWDKRNEQSKNLSGGMKRKLMIVRALVTNPKLLILDEPTAGVDVETRREMWNLLIELNKKGTTIILTTHYLEEAERLCKRIAIIDKGEIIENTTTKQLLSKLHKEAYILDVKDKVDEEKLPKGFNIEIVDDNTIKAEVMMAEDLNRLFEKLDKKGIKVLSMRNESNRLEEFYISLIRK